MKYLVDTHALLPFGRLIIWQAISRNISLISKDKHMKDYQKYGLEVLWK